MVAFCNVGKLFECGKVSDRKQTSLVLLISVGRTPLEGSGADAQDTHALHGTIAIFYTPTRQSHRDSGVHTAFPNRFQLNTLNWY